ncbi:hypothetical protein RJT34_30769 [Clitoria ternatea]|uniref:Exonuclease domain-containing protein n=1 Tax=Clitoria ternatea TaxID=43366 RepID=A0AAN9I0Q5_CLITE
MVNMDDRIETSDKKVLVDIVRLAQIRRLKGKQGDWREFLNSYDKKFGASLLDPAKKSHEVLAAFLKTFSKEEDLKCFYNIMRRHSNKYTMESLKSKSHVSPEQRLVQVTLQHPLYPSDYSFPSIDEGWKVINIRNKNKVMKSTEMFAVDCEMVLCEDGTEGLVKICVVDHNLEVKLNELVKPDKGIADYRTDITGVSSQDLEAVTCSLANIQKSMKKLLSTGSILVGHSLHNDLRVLKLDYVRVIDTSFIFQLVDGSIRRRPSLDGLCQAVLGHKVREPGAPHDCLDDACAAMKLVLARIKHGVDREFPIQLIKEPVSESDMAKLLLHRIPKAVNIETLHKIVPGDFKIELKPSRKDGRVYSALAIFKNPQDAHDAYESVQGSQVEDSCGHPQKLITFKLSKGESASLFVRKNATDKPHDMIPSKRALQVDEAVGISKKAKTDPKIDEDALTSSGNNDTQTHLNEVVTLNERLKQSDLEIESLKKELRQKDFEITMLNKMIASLKKRVK